jgi:hypothetical protein
VGVVNIDNGFGAAILAGQILRTAHKLRNWIGAAIKQRRSDGTPLSF